ncbi:hypothetical protein HMPREF0758_1447 [Serratia odorifera DSM 4582]|uniref:Uncharacterized protein n=1 Tax=Serratia odorifera DSM 4582 TaxID=667129 RepID=D4DZU7_SEROD|nr:hypothetical protein HMPREF0758_1447 [Serratia odorifera DSM 4582]
MGFYSLIKRLFILLGLLMNQIISPLLKGGFIVVISLALASLLLSKC